MNKNISAKDIEQLLNRSLVILANDGKLESASVYIKEYNKKRKAGNIDVKELNKLNNIITIKVFIEDYKDKTPEVIEWEISTNYNMLQGYFDIVKKALEEIS